MSTISKFAGRVVCTKAQFDALAEKDPNKEYFITDDDLKVVQATGTSTTDVMSQDATTKAINTAKSGNIFIHRRIYFRRCDIRYSLFSK